MTDSVLWDSSAILALLDADDAAVGAIPAGAIGRMGRVEDGTTVCDYDPEAAAAVGAPVVGGNLARGKETSITTTLLGRAAKPVRSASLACTVQALEGKLTPEENQRILESIERGKKEINSRQYTSWFNFRGGDQQKRVSDLSGGERNRELHHRDQFLYGGSAPSGSARRPWSAPVEPCRRLDGTTRWPDRD